MVAWVWMAAWVLAGEPRVLEVHGAPDEGRSWPRPFALQTAPDRGHREHRLALQDAGGRELPAAFEVVTRWHDGSPRWWRVCPGEWGRTGRAEIRVVPHRPRRRPSTLRTTRNGWTFAPRPGGDTLQREPGGLTYGTPTHGLAFQFGRMSVEADGLRETARAPEGELRSGPDEGGLGLELRLPFGDVSPLQVRVRASISPQARFLELELCLTARQPLALRRWTLPVQATGDPVRVEGLGQRLEAEGARSVSLQAPRDASTGSSGGPAATVQVGLGRQALSLCWPRLGVQRPAAITLHEDDVRLHLVDGDVFLDRGQTLRRRLLVGRGVPDAVARVRPRTIVRPTSPAGLDQNTRDWIDRWVAFLDLWNRNQPWSEDHGCYVTRHGTFANGEYDLGASLLALGCELGEAGWIELGEVTVRHTMDWDVAVDVPEPWPDGLFAHHGDRHASDKVETGHVWTDGFAQLFRATGDLDGYGTARRVGTALSSARPHAELFQGPERRLAWPLRAALDLSDLSEDHAWTGLARSLIGGIAERQTATGYLDGDRRPIGEEPRVWVNVWVALGITIDGLLRATEHLEDPRARQIATDYGSFVVDGAWRDGVLSEVLLVEPTSGVVEQRRGRCVKGGAALASAGLAGLAGVGGDPALVEAADALWQQALTDLATPRERDLVEWAKAMQALRRRLQLAGE